MIDDWINHQKGVIQCPKCGSFSVARIVIPWSGEELICSLCKFEEIVAPENNTKKRRRGFSL
jgi:hypothetical protein